MHVASLSVSLHVQHCRRSRLAQQNLPLTWSNRRQIRQQEGREIAPVAEQVGKIGGLLRTVEGGDEVIEERLERYRSCRVGRIVAVPRAD